MQILQLRPAALYALVTLLPTLTCTLLLYFAERSEGVAAGTALPLVVILLVGALFTSSLYALGRGLSTPHAWLTALASGALLNFALLSGLAEVASIQTSFLLAPLTAVALGALYPIIFRNHAAMLASMTVYVVCTLLANFTFDSFIALPLYGLLSVGTLFFGVTFTQRDRVHQYGRKNVYAMILFAAIANLLLSMYLGIPLRFLAAGFLAILIAETADTEVYGRLLARSWPLRVATSNAVSIPLDSTIFTLIAFAGNPAFPLGVMVEIIFADIVAKTVVGLIAAVRIFRHMPTHPLGSD